MVRYFELWSNIESSYLTLSKNQLYYWKMVANKSQSWICFFFIEISKSCSSCIPNSFPLTYHLPPILDLLGCLYVFWSVAFNFHFFSLWFFNIYEFLIILQNQNWKIIINYQGLDENSTSYYPLSFCTLWDWYAFICS